ncbi:zinc finger C3HC4 type (RING finger) domain containing protein [Gracilaria domingensis]|nr:zinc finger C3HC4 type (RING finger) domain containing protein [Gracilaria domingensis]
MPPKTSSPVNTAECVCIGACVGFECIKQRSNALLTLGRSTAALALVEKAIQDSAHDERLREDFQTVYSTIKSSERRNRFYENSLSKGADTRARDSSPNGENEGDTERAAKRCRIDRDDFLINLAEHLDCIICSKLLYEPVTTACGHTFCRSCLSRAVDVSDSCPMCRSILHLEDPSVMPITNVLRTAIMHCFPEEYEVRRKESQADAPSAENALNRLPLFPLNAVVFPMQRFPMHIFEARYQLMLRRIMQGSRKFGLVALKRGSEGGSELCDVGCVLEVTKVERFPDGRSLIQTVARERFSLKGRIEVDGYFVGRTEVFEDTEDTDSDDVRQVEVRVREILNGLLERGARLPPIRHALQRAGQVPTEVQGAAALGMWLAGMLVSDLNERQHFLELSNSKTRLLEMEKIVLRFRESLLGPSGLESRECCIQ